MLLKINILQKAMVAVSIMMCITSCTATKDNTQQVADLKMDTVFVDNESLKYEGRFVFGGDSVRYDYPGSSISFCFTGTSVEALLKNQAGYYWVEIDDNEPYKLTTHATALGGYSAYPLAKGLESGQHKVVLTLISEGLFVKPACWGFLLEKGNGVVRDTTRRDLKIEFIGNSITCGYGVEAVNGQAHFSDSTSNVCKAYAMLTAKALNAEKMMVARSGIGIYRNYGEDPNGSEFPMSKVYFSSLISDPSDKWDFKSFTPDVLCLNLGTNDMSTEGYVVEKFEEVYNVFVRNIRKEYPTTKIVLLTGTMLNGQPAIDQMDVLNRVAKGMQEAGDSLVYRFDMTPQDGALGYGADMHPSGRTQERMASELTAFIRTIL